MAHKLYMGIDQYGMHYHGLKHPRKELSEALGNTHVSKMYCDKSDGTVKHTGYVIGNHWITLYEVKPFEKDV